MQGYGWRTAMALAIGLAALAVPSVASAQAVPDASCPGPFDSLFGSTGDTRFAQVFTAQNSGILTMAQVEVGKSGTSGDYVMRINAVDGSGTPTNDTLASTTISDATVPDGISTVAGHFANPATVVAGQQYALVITRPGSSSLQVSRRSNDTCPGQSFFSFSQTDPFNPEPHDLIFAVFVEPPPADPGPQPGDTTAPDTTITKQPKDRTKKKNATFEFTSSEPGSTFFCGFDGAPLTPCTSPETEKVGKGKHEFDVVAVDPAGNKDATPAEDDWKVKKKKK